MKPDRRPAGPGGGRWVERQHPAPDLYLNAKGAEVPDLFGGTAPSVGYHPIRAVADDQDFSHRRLCDADFRDTSVRGARFHGADLRDADLSGVEAQGADFARADLTGADLTGGQFDGADLREAEIRGHQRGASFDRAVLDGAVLGDTADTTFRGASLRSATLSGTFTRCDFRGADFSGTQMDHGYQKQLNRGLDAVTFVDCRFDVGPCVDRDTSWPDYIDPD